MTIDPIGIVHSPVVERRDMPEHGVRAQVEVFPEFRDGLMLIEDNTHLWILGWFIGAERDQLQIVRPEYRAGQRRRGVFGLRSTTRPNSIGLCVSALLDVRDGWLTVDQLDFLDGTPVIDIKRYSPSWDSVFSARSSQDLLVDTANAARREQLEVDAAKFHGALVPAAVATVRLMQHVILEWQVLPRDPGLRIAIPASGTATSGEYIDALQGITGATFGSGRLALRDGNAFQIEHGDHAITFVPRDVDNLPLDEIRRAPLASLFETTPAL